jgi:ankyrin repeat protein
MSSQIEGFQTLQTWYDVVPFAERVVAYTKDTSYFGAEKGYKRGETYFGYIGERAYSRKDKEMGFTMQRLLKPDGSEGPRALVESLLKSSLSMRLATNEEIGFLRDAVTAGQAKFEMMRGKDEMIDILERSLHPGKPLFTRPFGIRCASCNEFLAAPVIIQNAGRFFHKKCHDAEFGQRFTQGIQCHELEELISRIDSLNRIICKVDEPPSVARLFTLALEQGDVSVAAFVVSSFPNLVNTLVDGVSPLYRVCERGQIESVRFLLEHSANPNIQNDLTPEDQDDRLWSTGIQSPLHQAAPIRAAAQLGSIEITDLLIDTGAFLDEPGPLGRTPLFEAVLAGHDDLALWLIEKKANKATKDKFGDSLLAAAARADRIPAKVVKILLQDNLYIKESELGMFLFRVAGTEEEALLQFLLDHGGKEIVNKRVVDGKTPIRSAVDHGKLENVKILLKADASFTLNSLSLLNYARRKLEEQTVYYSLHPDAIDKEKIIKESQAIVEYLSSLKTGEKPHQ